MWRSKPPADLIRACARALRRAWRDAVRTARLAVGVPDYDAYVAHVRRRHPDRTPMDPRTFFRERIEARYGRGRSRCC